MSVKIRSALIALALVISFSVTIPSAQAVDSVTVGGITYELHGRQATVVSGFTDRPNIPSLIWVGSLNYLVTSIADDAFTNKHLISVSIPDSVTRIGNRAFQNNQLTSVTIPSSVIELGNVPFDGNPLETLTFLGSPPSINFFGFGQLSSLAHIDVSYPGTGWGQTFAGLPVQVLPIPLPGIPNVTSVVPGNGKLTVNFTVPESDGGLALTGYQYSLDGGVEWSLSEVAPIVITGLNNGTSYSIKIRAVNSWGPGATSSSVEATPGPFTYTSDSQGDATITGYDGIVPTDLVIPSTLGGHTVTGLGPWAFAHRSLSSVVIPASVTTIGPWAFDTNNLTTVAIPDSVTSIGGAAFSGNALTSITIPESVKSIGHSAFSGNALTSITIPESVTELGSYAFARTDIATVTFEGVMPTLGSNVFLDSPLSTVVAPSGKKFPKKLAGVKVNLAPVPNVPGITSLVAGNEMITVTMSAPSSSGGLKLRGYEVSTDNGVTWEAPDESSTENSLVINELTNGRRYLVKVRAFNASGPSAATKVAFVTPITRASAPGLTTHTYQGNRFTVRLSAPVSTGGGSVTKYQYSTDGGFTWLDLSVNATKVNTSISRKSDGTAFIAGHAYYFNFRSVTKAGFGATSMTYTANAS